MTPGQIEELEAAGKANSRLHLCAPISGTVIEKVAVEGEYVKTGQVIYRLADLSTVWLMLQLFPEDAATIRYGQKVEAEVQSLPGHTFAGRVAFIDPTVDPQTRTVGVRVVIPNDEGLLRVGDYAHATIAVPLGVSGKQLAETYDPELADKWIGPRHPHIIESAPGKCPICGSELIAATRLGFTNRPTQSGQALVVPRDAVLLVGQHSVVYVETEPGHFEIRRVVLGPSAGDDVAILSGIQEGTQVACSGNFLIDSQMQLAGKPSLIDPTKAAGSESRNRDKSSQIDTALAQLSTEDRALARRQRICPVTEMALGSMGTPLKIDVNGRPVFICCEGCRESLLQEPARYLANLTQDLKEADSGGDMPQMDLPPIGVPEIVEMPEATELEAESPAGSTASNHETEPAISAGAFDSLAPADRRLAVRQQICPVSGMPLGSMGTPIKVAVGDRFVFICCEGCRDRLQSEPVKYLARLPKEMAQ